MEPAAQEARLEPLDNSPPGAEQRNAPRFTLLIRAAKLVSAQGEFVCVIRDVSESGVSVRLFHALPACPDFALHMPAGAVYEVAPVWQKRNEAGFTFAEPVEVEKLVNESSEYPKRGLRLALCFPVTINMLSGPVDATVENLSQQGARLTCDALLAIDQNVRLRFPSPGGGTAHEVRAKVRWRREQHYGVVFDDTFTLGDFARLAAKLQAPALLDNETGAQD